jgi:Pol polyprotein, beta-barrel domain
VLDTGTTSHMTPHKNLLRNYCEFSQPKTIRAANKGTFDAFGSGLLVLLNKVGDKTV